MMSDEFAQRCAKSAGDLALLFAGEPDEKMLVALSQSRQNLTEQLAESFGAEVAALIAQAFVTAVIGRKAELEKASSHKGQLQNVRSRY
jgi:hypothetical protein